LPQYFFDIEDSETRQDDDGVELSSDAAAIQEARLRALNFDHSHRLQTYRGYCRIIVRDGSGRVVTKVPIEH
jgi:hypothetical protein